MILQNNNLAENKIWAEVLTQRPHFLQSIIGEIYRCTPLRQFKEDFTQIVALSTRGELVPVELAKKTQVSFRKTLSYLNTMIYHLERFSDDQKDTIGCWVHQEFIAYCLLATWPSRGFIKPQNIAGDHYTIKQIYNEGSKERRSVGHVINLCFFNEPACKAVVNRKVYMRNHILRGIHENQTSPFSVASIASGPAEEIFEVFDVLGSDKRSALKVVGIDIDKRACASVDDRIYSQRLQNYFSTCSYDVLKIGRQQEFKEQYDLVYSMGLIDYFKDRATTKILNNLYEMLKPGGEVVVGNFHISCDSRIFLDYILDWKLIYRTEDDMRRLFSQSAFGDSEVTVDFEEEGANMLVRCKKPLRAAII